MPIEYINSAGSTSVTIQNCDATTGWVALAGSGSIGTTGYVHREGVDGIEWGGDTGGPRGYYYDIGVGSEFNIDNDDLSAWFLPAEKYQGTTYLTLDGTDPDAVMLRLSSAADLASNYGDFYRALGGVNKLTPSWNSLICSGNTANATSGTFNRTSIRSFAVCTNQIGDNNTSFFTSTPDHGMDWFKLGRDIRITGTNGGQPWTFADIYNQLETSAPYHGLVQKRENLYIINAGIIIGDGTTATTFEDDSAFVFIDQVSFEVPHDFRIKANATVTLGKKTTGATRNYATGGVRITTRSLGSHNSDFEIEDGATVNLYGCKIENWANVNIGDGLGTDPIVEVIKADLYNNNYISLSSTGLDMLDVRMHFPDGSESDIGAINVSPTALKNIRVFQGARGLSVYANATIEDYYAGDNDLFDLSIKEAITAQLLNPVNFNYNKLERIP